MDELIYLESDEEITSVIDKLKQTEGKSVGLVVPKGASIIQSVVNLKLLKKEAEVLGKEIAIISQDKIGRNLASQVGLTVYDSVKAEKPVMEHPRPEIPSSDIIEIDLSEKKPPTPPPGVEVHRYDEVMAESPTHIVAKPLSAEDYKIPQARLPKKPLDRKKLFLCFSAFLLILFGFYLFYPKAVVFLAVTAEPFEKSIQITLDNNINKIEESRGAMPGDLQEVESEETKEFQATGKKEVGEKASGTITVYNEWDSETHSYPSGAKFTTADKTFLANNSFTVPAGTLVAGKIQAGTINVSVTAEKAGDSYNLGPTTFSLEGAPSKISGRNSQAMSGGSTRQLTVLSSDDLNNAKNSLKEELAQKNHQELAKKAAKQKIIESSIQDEIVSSSADKQSGEETDKFKLTMKVKSTTLSFKEDDFRAFLGQLLIKEVPPGKKLVSTTSDEVSITKTEADFGQGLMKLTGLVKTKLAPDIKEKDLKKALAGKSKFEAEEYLDQIEGIEKAEVKFRPSWWLKKVPRLKSNIEIKFEYQ